jgi:hypothetical protein
MTDFLRLLSWRGCFIEPIRQEGFSDSGLLYVADPYDRLTPFVMARIIECHPACRYVKAGQLVITRPHCFEHFPFEGKDYALTHEDNCLAVVQDHPVQESEQENAQATA